MTYPVPAGFHTECWEWFTRNLRKIDSFAFDRDKYTNSFGYIYGASLAMQDSLMYLLLADPKRADKRYELLQRKDLETIIRPTNGFVRWKRSEVARMYACEFFLNKAQSNIAAAADAIINQWIIDEVPGPYRSSVARVQFDLLGTYLISRLGIVSAARAVQREKLKMERKDIQPSPVFDVLEKAWDKTGTLYDTKTAGDVVKSNAKVAHRLIQSGQCEELLPPGPWETAHLVYTYTTYTGEQYIDAPLTIIDCLAIVNSRVNAYKHLPDGHKDREGHDFYFAEWMLTMRALLCVSELFCDKVGRVVQSQPPTQMEMDV